MKISIGTLEAAIKSSIEAGLTPFADTDALSWRGLPCLAGTDLPTTVDGWRALVSPADVFSVSLSALTILREQVECSDEDWIRIVGAKIAHQFKEGSLLFEEELLEEHEASILVGHDACVVAYVFEDGSVLACEYGQDQDVRVAATFASLEEARKEYALVEVEE